MQIVEIEIDKIITDKDQPRKYFDEQKIDELSNSISVHGLLSPVIVKNTGHSFALIAGERRLRACKKLGMKKIPAIIKQEENYQIVALIENIQRENLSALEEAIAINDIKVNNNFTQEQLAKLLGKTRTYIANKLRLLNLDDVSKKYLLDGKITEGHAKALLSQKNLAKREKLLEKILFGNLSVRDAEKSAKKQKPSDCKEDLEEIKNILEDNLATKVDIQSSSKGGKITIEYFSDEELRSIVEKIIGSEN